MANNHDGADRDAPQASVVVPSVFGAVRNDQSQLLPVRRRDSGAWGLPDGRVDVGESAVGAAVRETVEESGVVVRITGLVGLFTDPEHIGECHRREVRQQFVVCLHAWAVRGTPVPDLHERSTPPGSTLRRSTRRSWSEGRGA